MEGSCSTGQSPQRVIVPVEEEVEDVSYLYIVILSYMLKFISDEENSYV
jgi:hypothetical protein